ncbi:NAD(P)/FAD-dependent oxidoreductase [Gluconacetobacter sp. Hr-1-5]|uniref:NAD(P)/FAD-dependent oxidoreductase n=1 Tax=Gluconacetobacter sp. Hr-1-5 TaxID=3395370 RepID=UPI003B52A18B
MGPEVVTIESDTTPPAATDVVVIGGGIVGASTALALSRKGIDVTLCEKGVIGAEQSSRNWGWVRKNGRDAREIPLMLESMRIWHGLGPLEQADTGFKVTGVLSVALTEADQARHERWAENARIWQTGSRVIGSSEIAELLPGATRSFRSALYNATDARAEPQKAAPAIAAAARARGAHVLQSTAVRGLDVAGGRVRGVFTEKGRIACNAVVVAGGAWSRLLLGNHDLTLPQLKVLASVARTSPIAGLPEVSAYTGKVAFRKRDDGGYNFAQSGTVVAPIVPDTIRFLPKFLPALRAERRALKPRLDHRFIEALRQPRHWAMDQATIFERVRTLDPKPVAALLKQAEEAFLNLFPQAAGMKVVQTWGGMIDVMPDAVPTISPVPGVEGVIVATGFSGHGFGIGPGAGQLAADLATGADPVVDPAPFRWSRFTDGSKLQIDVGF